MLALALTLSLAASPLQEAQSHYADLDYEGCVAALAPALGRIKGQQRATAEMYFGLCQFALGKEAEARRHLEAALRIDPTLRSPAAASPKERELFEDVARAVAASPRPAPAPAGRKQPAGKEPEAHAEKPAEHPTETPPAPAPAPDKPAAEPAKSPPPTVAAAPEPAPTAAPASATNVTAVVEPSSPPSRVPPAVLTAAALVLAGTGGIMAFNAKLWESAGNSSTLAQPEVPRYANEATTRIIAADVLFGLAGLSAAIALWLWIRAFSG